MSSVPTHSNSGSLNASSGPAGHCGSSAAPSDSPGPGSEPSPAPWGPANAVDPDSSSEAAGSNSSSRTKANREAASPLSTHEPIGNLSGTSGGIRSPISTDEALIECLERRLLERSSELQELQASLEEKEEESCQLFDRRQRNRSEQMEGLKQRCAAELRHLSQMASKAQQALQLQVSQLQVSPRPPSPGGPPSRWWGREARYEESMSVQAEREKLQGDVSKLSQEKGLVELRLRSCQTHNTRLAPTLEETQWEVSPLRDHAGTLGQPPLRARGAC